MSKGQKERSLSTVQERVSHIVQHEVINRHFQYSDNDFQVLSTIRYDPAFTHVFSDASSEGIIFDEIDPRLIETFEVPTTDLNDELFMNFFLEDESASGVTLKPVNSLVEIFNQAEKHAPKGPQNSALPQKHSSLYQTFYNRFLLLGEHYKRLNLSVNYFDWECQIPIQLLLKELIRVLPAPVECDDIESKMKNLLNDRRCYKMRVLVSSTGKMRIEAHELPCPTISVPTTTQYFINTILGGFLPQQDVVWDVFIDTEPMVISPFTTFKTTKRDHYTKARERMSQLAKDIGSSSPKCEILVYNSAYQLMEGSITNAAVLQGDKDSTSLYKYVTPYLASGCLCGVMRHYLLSKRLIQEDVIDIRNLKLGDEILLFNGVMGCVKGVVRNSLQK